MTYLDSHRVKPDPKLLEAERLAIRQGQRDQFGVKPLNTYWSEDVPRSFCLTDAPTAEAVRKTHEAMGIACDEIVAVKALV